MASPSIEEIVNTTVKDRASHMADSISYFLYADRPGFVSPTRWQRFVRYWKGFPERARDAWLVLTGRASIGDEY